MEDDFNDFSELSAGDTSIALRRCFAQVAAERDQLRAMADAARDGMRQLGSDLEACRVELAESRQAGFREVEWWSKRCDAATARAEAAEKEALDYIDYRNQAVISRNAMERRLEAAESLVAGLRGALEVLLKCNALGVAIPWGKAVSVLTEADRLKKEAANG